MALPQNENLSELEARIGYRFTDGALLEQALTHSSHANECTDTARMADYERLEYLGDAVLEMVSSDFLFHRFPELPEGVLTRYRAALVCEEALFSCARVLDLATYIRLGRGEESTGGREKPSILSDVTEAVIGAIYLDGGLPAADAFIRAHVLTDVEAKLQNDDAKSKLQEYAQRTGKADVIYEVVRQDGPEHSKVFTSAVYIGDRFLAEGTGKNKKASQQEAAKAALQILCI